MAENISLNNSVPRVKDLTKWSCMSMNGTEGGKEFMTARRLSEDLEPTESDEKVVHEEGLRDNIFQWLRREREARCDEISRMLSPKPSRSEEHTFHVVMRKRHLCEVLGIQVLHSAGRCHVTDLKPGVVTDWNRQNPDLKILVGDSILAANGLTRYQDIRIECRTALVLRLHMSRLCRDK